jgi:hypothetical protein
MIANRKMVEERGWKKKYGRGFHRMINRGEGA